MFWRSWRKKSLIIKDQETTVSVESEETLFSDEEPLEKAEDGMEPLDLEADSEDEVESEEPVEAKPALKEPTNFEVREMVMRQLKEARKIARYMQSTEDLVEEKIRKAIEKGDFDKVEGKGKPIKMEENPFEDPSLRLPFKVLKDAGYAPYWIELGKDIDAGIEGAQMLFDKFLDGIRWRKSRRGFMDWNPELDQRREQVLESCARKLEEVNKKIDLYNRIVPIYWMQRKKVDERMELSNMRKKWEDLVVRPTLKDKDKD